MKRIFYTFFAVLLLSACSTSRVSERQLEKAKIQFLLVTNQIGPHGALVSGQSLSAITAADQNKEGYVPMLAWKDKGDAEKYYAAVGSLDTFTSNYLTWVTKKSEMIQRTQALKMQRFSGERLALRMEQLLGLEPRPQKDSSRVFIEIWVKESDLFRPCRDPEISDLSCSLHFPLGAYASQNTAYDTVYEELVKNNERKEPPTDAPSYWAPWTRMGYTYDWHSGNRSHVGMSEYIIRQGAIVWIKGKTTTEDWLATYAQ
ncbi:MAG: membrane lipoprotein lipid attachment site-containing protein [Saprospiraceae bacterium]|nr:membrane lipoprotein lipid attachment site-containing protein [Saprospiraceae bacterium]